MAGRLMGVVPPLTTGPQAVLLLLEAAALIAPRRVQAPVSPVEVTVTAEAPVAQERAAAAATAIDAMPTFGEFILERSLVVRNGPAATSLPIVAPSDALVKRPGDR